jgi:hypothetical protein
MNTQLMISPSSLLPEGIRITKVDNHYLFKLTEELQSRLEFLLEKRKLTTLEDIEAAEYAVIAELERIFTLLNAMIIAQR